MFEFDGKKILLKLAKQAGYENKLSLVASNTLFVHPTTVQETKNSPLFRIIRDFPKRTQIIDWEDGQKVMCCDNTGPQHAIEWAIGGMKKIDVQINHIYSESKNVSYYTSLANLCATPTFIAKLTDTDKEVQELLRYRSYDLYGFYLSAPPHKPDGYEDLKWMDFVPPIINLERYFRERMKRSSKSRTAISAREIGWFYSDFKPDPTV